MQHCVACWDGAQIANTLKIQRLDIENDDLKFKKDPEIGRTMSLSGYGTRILELWDVETDTLEEKAMFHHVAMGKLFNDYRRRMIKNNTKSASNIMAAARHLAEGWLSTLQSTLLKAAVHRERSSSRGAFSRRRPQKSGERREVQNTQSFTLNGG